MTTGELIRKARKEAGLTQAQLAKKLDIPYQSIGQWERNVRKPKYDTLKKIANALNIKWTELVPENSIAEIHATLTGGNSDDLKVGNSYFHGAMIISQVDEKDDEIKIVFKMDEEKFTSEDINLFRLFSGILEMERIMKKEGPQLLEAVLTKKKENAGTDENER